MDMLDFDAADLYFDEPINAQAQDCIDLAAQSYASDQAEQPLMRAYFLEPEHPMVLVALYRFFYYQHRFEEALMVAERTLDIFSTRLHWPMDWNELNENYLSMHKGGLMTLVRFYLLCLKGAGYLELRLGRHDTAMARLAKVAQLDSKDRLGAKALLDVANNVLNPSDDGEIYQLF